MNPILNNLNRNNPMDFINNLINTNPQAQMIVNIIKNGGNAEQMFYEQAQKMGVDPQQVLSQLGINR